MSSYADTAAEDPAYMIYTSGTGSRPKGVVHAHRVLLGRAPMRAEWEAIGPDDVMLHAGAFNWSYTLGVGLLDPWSVGACAVLYAGEKDIKIWPRTDPRDRRDIVRGGAVALPADPQILRASIAATSRACATRLRQGRRCQLRPHEAWLAATGRELYEAFGMSECSTFVSSGPKVPVRAGSAGKPQAGRRVAILPVEEGMIRCPRARPDCSPSIARSPA